MSRLVIDAALLDEVRKRLLASAVESCAILYGRAVEVDGQIVRLIIREAEWPMDCDYAVRTDSAAILTPQYVARAAQRSRRTGESLVFVHSHPFALNFFSSTDTEGEAKLAEFLQRRTPNLVHAALLITPEVSVARILGETTVLEVIGVGPTLVWGTMPESTGSALLFDRQVRAFGIDGQKRLSRMRIAIVGVGGTGSVVVQQLAHLGVTDFLLLDPDTVEPTNLNRLVGSGPADVGRAKVDVAAEAILNINPTARIERRRESVLVEKSALRLVGVDFVFACTDSHGSRAVLNQLAYQYLVPVVDMGVSIVVAGGKVTHVVGRTQMLAPTLGCMQCGNLLHPEAVRVDLLSDYERADDQYIVGTHEPAPAVISLNSVVASYAVTMFLGASAGFPSEARLLNYNAAIGTTRLAAIARHPNCIVCSRDGALARGNEWPLPARAS